MFFFMLNKKILSNGCIIMIMGIEKSVLFLVILCLFSLHLLKYIYVEKS